jgi:hypothetical protein
MKFKILSVALLTLAPTFVSAAGCSEEKVTATMSCAADKVFDHETKTCVPVSG